MLAYSLPRHLVAAGFVWLCLGQAPSGATDGASLLDSPTHPSQPGLNGTSGAYKPLTPALPLCSSIGTVKPVRDANGRMIGKRVVLRGVLTFGQGNSIRCEMRTTWRVVDADGDPFKRAAPALLVKLRDDKTKGLWSVSWTGQRPEPPDLDVVATGILRKASQGSVYYDYFLLEEATLCRPKLDAKNPQRPIPHPPDEGWDDLVGCGKL